MGMNDFRVSAALAPSALSGPETAETAVLRGRRIVLGVTGGIAAYKAAELCRLLVKAGADVRVVLTDAATQFITPLTMQTLSGAPRGARALRPRQRSRRSATSASPTRPTCSSSRRPRPTPSRASAPAWPTICWRRSCWRPARAGAAGAGDERQHVGEPAHPGEPRPAARAGRGRALHDRRPRPRAARLRVGRRGAAHRAGGDRGGGRASVLAARSRRPAGRRGGGADARAGRRRALPRQPIVGEDGLRHRGGGGGARRGGDADRRAGTPVPARQGAAAGAGWGNAARIDVETAADWSVRSPRRPPTPTSWSWPRPSADFRRGAGRPASSRAAHAGGDARRWRWPRSRTCSPVWRGRGDGRPFLVGFAAEIGGGAAAETRAREQAGARRAATLIVANDVSAAGHRLRRGRQRGHGGLRRRRAGRHRPRLEAASRAIWELCAGCSRRGWRSVGKPTTEPVGRNGRCPIPGSRPIRPRRCATSRPRARARGAPADRRRAPRATSRPGRGARLRLPRHAGGDLDLGAPPAAVGGRALRGHRAAAWAFVEAAARFVPDALGSATATRPPTTARCCCWPVTAEHALGRVDPRRQAHRRQRRARAVGAPGRAGRSRRGASSATPASSPGR